MAERRVETPREYYSHPEVARSILRHLGNTEELPEVLSLLECEKEFHYIDSEYLAISNPEIKNQKDRSPARSVKPWEIPAYLRHNPVSEIFRSLWSRDSKVRVGHPGAQIIPWDVEYFNLPSPGYAFIDQREVFEKMEPAFQEMEATFGHYGIQHMTVMTGRGYHFLTQVPSVSPVMQDLIEIGNVIEEPVSSLQRQVPMFSKRDRPVPPNSQLAYKGANRLMQYVFGQTINNARAKSVLPIEISDRGEEGISFDETGYVRHLGTAVSGTLGSIYMKPLIKEAYYVPNTRLITRIARNVGGQEIDEVPALIQVRQNYKKSVDNLAQSGGFIPDGSAGVARLIKDYKRSELRQLHLALDNEPGDPPEKWRETYRKDDYAWIKDINPHLHEKVMNANPLLLQPDDLNYFINTIYDAWGAQLSSAGHIAALMRSIYEDNFGWGSRFSRHDSATAHATAWTAIILGQRFEKR
ncbi:MAG: hypothetical protein US75_C0018G0015 [Candidatus Woesebacteria bacterium GW2011_GWC1_38_13]|uniref:Uncharacterized protein n=1 Tax=Candidatus Woesebacteria bacterium GW2011_GWC1_38_13 TaxID=1618583 RepID=A0A0G0ILX0_9BACT|nr:MAG: hypothetical protein US75_C0018G0015 [Candidatus Woesebacteria bacterium GW2011_GWC1_38_13]